MKRIITFGLALVMILSFLSGCFVAVDDRERDERHERGERHERDGWHEERR